MADSATDALKSKKQLLLNLLTAVLLLVTVATCFHKTIFAGVPISRVYQLGQRDTLFSKYFTPNREGYDASVYQYFVPSHFFLTNQLRQGVIPFWNPLVGCGAPFLADVETAVFWPFRLLLLWLPPLKAWNLLIVANVINFAIGTFLLGKALKLRRFAIIFSSLSCAFCPYLIFQSELIGSSASMIPLVMASFVNAHTRRTLLSRFLAGMACAVMILSGHPEPSFFGIACASLLYICLEFLSTDLPDKAPKRFLKSLLNISIIGLVAFSFCAFMLLPFVELLKHSDCYKLGLTGHRPGVPLNSILINLIHPAYGNSSPYLGILCVPLTLIAVFFGLKTDKTVRAITLSILISIAAMSQLGPLDLLMNSKAFSWFVPKYCWPSLLVMLSILAGCGFQSLTSELIKTWRKTSACTIICALLTIVSLAALRVSPGLLDCIRQDEAFEHMQIFGKFFTRDIILLAVFCVAVVLSRFLGKAQAAVCVLAVSICTILSLAPVAKLASPTTQDFNYDVVEPIKYLQDQNARLVTMGRHVFCPSSNFCYDVNNIVPVNVYHPYRFQQFLISSGITPEGVNQFFDGRLTSIIDLAAVKFVVTPQPVLNAQQILPQAESIEPQLVPNWGSPEKGTLKLTAAAFTLHPQNREIQGQLKFSVTPERARNLGVQTLLMDGDNKNVLWLSDIDRLKDLYSSHDQDGKVISISKDLLVPLPANNKKVNLLLQIFDWDSNKYISSFTVRAASEAASQSTQETNKKQEELNSFIENTKDTASEVHNTGKEKLVLLECDLSNELLKSTLSKHCQVSHEEQQFKLMQETASHIRVYENTHALPKAYICHDFDVCKSTDDVLTAIRAPQFNPRNSAVLEGSNNDGDGTVSKADLESLQLLKASQQSNETTSPTFTRENCNNILIEANTNAPAILVLTENYYPGWKATITQGSVSSPAKIMRVNYLFQAIAIPKGASKIHFQFEPNGFLPGLILFALASIAGIALLLLRKR